ncbi:MAG: hypothetical protein ACRDOK_30005 [Streptosporangiaceae bacterium]
MQVGGDGLLGAVDAAGRFGERDTGRIAGAQPAPPVEPRGLVGGEVELELAASWRAEGE